MKEGLIRRKRLGWKFITIFWYSWNYTTKAVRALTFFITHHKAVNAILRDFNVFYFNFVLQILIRHEIEFPAAIDWILFSLMLSFDACVLYCLFKVMQYHCLPSQLDKWQRRSTNWIWIQFSDQYRSIHFNFENSICFVFLFTFVLQMLIRTKFSDIYNTLLERKKIAQVYELRAAISFK